MSRRRAAVRVALCRGRVFGAAVLEAQRRRRRRGTGTGVHDEGDAAARGGRAVAGRASTLRLHRRGHARRLDDRRVAVDRPRVVVRVRAERRTPREKYHPPAWHLAQPLAPPRSTRANQPRHVDGIRQPTHGARGDAELCRAGSLRRSLFFAQTSKACGSSKVGSAFSRDGRRPRRRQPTRPDR